jgi:hypothetical protein
MTEHSPDQELRLLEGSSADQRTVTVEVVGGTVASGNVAYATERIEQLCRHAPGAPDCRAHLFASSVMMAARWRSPTRFWSFPVTS